MITWARTIEDIADARVVYFLRRCNGARSRALYKLPLLARPDPRARPRPLVLREVGRAEVGRCRSIRREQHYELRGARWRQHPSVGGEERRVGGKERGRKREIK